MHSALHPVQHMLPDACSLQVESVAGHDGTFIFISDFVSDLPVTAKGLR